MKIDRYEIAALRERIRSARKETESLEHQMKAKMHRLERIRAELDTIKQKIDYWVETMGLQIREARCPKCGAIDCTQHGLLI